MMSEECHTEHEEIKEALLEHSKGLEFHIAEMHGRLMDRAEVLASDEKIHSELELLAGAVLGPQRGEFFGGGRDSNKGLLFLASDNNRRIVNIEGRLRNGGITARLPASVIGTIIVAALTSITSVIIAIIQHI